MARVAAPEPGDPALARRPYARGPPAVAAPPGARAAGRPAAPRPRGATPPARPCVFRTCGRAGAAPAGSGRARCPPGARASWGRARPAAPEGPPAAPRGRPGARWAVHNSEGCTPWPAWLRRGRATRPARVVRTRGVLLPSPPRPAHGPPAAPRLRGATPPARPCVFRTCGRVGAAPAASRRVRGPPGARTSWGRARPAAPGGLPAAPWGRPAARGAVHNSGGCTPWPAWLRRSRATRPQCQRMPWFCCPEETSAPLVPQLCGPSGAFAAILGCRSLVPGGGFGIASLAGAVEWPREQALARAQGVRPSLGSPPREGYAQ